MAVDVKSVGLLAKLVEKLEGSAGTLKQSAGGGYSAGLGQDILMTARTAVIPESSQTHSSN